MDIAAVQMPGELRPLKFRKFKGRVHLIETVMSSSRRIWTHSKSPYRPIPSCLVGESTSIESFCGVRYHGNDDFVNDPVDCFHCFRAMDRNGITEEDLGTVVEQTEQSIIAGIKQKYRKGKICETTQDAGSDPDSQ